MAGNVPSSTEKDQVLPRKGMGCGASAPVVAPVAAQDDARAQHPAPAATPLDAAPAAKHPPREHEAAPGPQAPADPAPPGAGAATPPDSSPRDDGAAAPAAPAGVGGELAAPAPAPAAPANAVAYDDREGEDRLQWGSDSFTVEELNEVLERLDGTAAQYSLEELLPQVREDALRYSEAYETLRNEEGGAEALEELAHECAAIRIKVLEDRDDSDTVTSSSFDNGEGDEEPVDNFWNEPFFLLVSGAKVYGKFTEWVASIAAQADANAAHSVCFKPISSAAQKARRPVWQRGGAAAVSTAEAGGGRGWGSLVDVIRASIVVDDWHGILRCLQAVRGDFDVEILRIRNRFTATADVPQLWGGYRHIALSVRLLGHGHVCEVLVHHRQLCSLRSPEAEGRFHRFRDALAWTQDGQGGVETYVELLSPRA